ncbi:hypothetical protein PAMC26577_30995 [Caballeronia sordidicola]|uniref:Uncharacterized protein n=1 Tax=Caballeronia sordidicola TaxID=196367 RepID=A0A242ME55_CABSO|nr:hypothetical protein PAMC26577_30995 [Caballeronia sordidicola]
MAPDGLFAGVIALACIDKKLQLLAQLKLQVFLGSCHPISVLRHAVAPH